MASALRLAMVFSRIGEAVRRDPPSSLSSAFSRFRRRACRASSRERLRPWPLGLGQALFHKLRLLFRLLLGEGGCRDLGRGHLTVLDDAVQAWAPMIRTISV